MGEAAGARDGFHCAWQGTTCANPDCKANFQNCFLTKALGLSLVRSNTECRLTSSRGIKSQLNALIVFLPYPLNKGTENVSILLKRRALNPL